mmetsp:Transcript_27251/g.54419  ORF Transcript_27251/g.54419 Transcript_27251/m.54419 type:complete len:205 (-) Transcript_27251:104-718(-)
MCQIVSGSCLAKCSWYALASSATAMWNATHLNLDTTRIRTISISCFFSSSSVPPPLRKCAPLSDSHSACLCQSNTQKDSESISPHFTPGLPRGNCFTSSRCITRIELIKNIISLNDVQSPCSRHDLSASPWTCFEFKSLSTSSSVAGSSKAIPKWGMCDLGMRTLYTVFDPSLSPYRKAPAAAHSARESSRRAFDFAMTWARLL